MDGSGLGKNNPDAIILIWVRSCRPAWSWRVTMVTWMWSWRSLRVLIWTWTGKTTKATRPWSQLLRQVGTWGYEFLTPPAVHAQTSSCSPSILVGFLPQSKGIVHECFKSRRWGGESTNILYSNKSTSSTKKITGPSLHIPLTQSCQWGGPERGPSTSITHSGVLL